MRLQGDLAGLETQFKDIIFWEGDQDTSSLSDQEWQTMENKRELQMKKLMTVGKSKYYMLKINYKSVFDQIDSEIADNQSNTNGFGKPDHSDRLH